MNSKLSLRWRDHHSALITMLENHLDNSTLSDCVIAAEGQYIKAHKVVLSSCSPYFQLLFTLENEKNPIVVLKDVKFDDLKAVIDFVYRGEVQVFEDQLVTFLETAESLQIKGLGRNNNERFGKRKKGDSSGKRSRERSSTPTPEENTAKKHAYEAEEEALELVPVLENNEREEWKSKRESYCTDLPSTSSRNVPPAYNFRSSTRASSTAQTSAINLEIAPALPEPSLSVEDCLAETESVVKTESLSDSEMGQTEEYMDDALSESGADSFIKNDMEDMVGPNTGQSVNQSLMRNHYGGGPSQSEPTNLTSDNSMMTPQMNNSQDFMLGLGSLDSSASGPVSSGHMPAEPSTSQGGVPVPPPSVQDPVAAVAAAAAAAVPPPPPPATSASQAPPVQPQLPPPTQPPLQMQAQQLAPQLSNPHLTSQQLPHTMPQQPPSISQPPQLAPSAPQMSQPSSFDPAEASGAGSDAAAALASLQGHPLAAVLADGDDDDEIQVIADMVHPVDPRELLLAGGGGGGGGGGGSGGGGGGAGGAGGGGGRGMGSAMGGMGGRPGKKHCCPECEKAFAAPSLLERHRRVHTGERPFRCEMCDATFRQLDALKRHHNVHTAERPHKCDQCGNAFKTIDCLKRHQRIHTGERPYRCGVCEAAFSQSSALVYHIRIHTGERPYPCPDCGRSFIRKAVLQKHMRSIHGRFPGKL